MTAAEVFAWMVDRIEQPSPMLAARLRQDPHWTLSDGTAAAGYFNGLLCVLDGWELEDLTLPILEALAAAAPAFAVVLRERHAFGWGPAGDCRDARTPWVQRIRMQLGLTGAAGAG